MKLGEKILSARKKAGLSQVDLADALGVSRQSVSKWETGEANPEIGKLPELARLLGVSTDWLLSEEDEPAKERGEAGFGPVPQINIDQKTYPEWLDHMPGNITKMVKKYGWLYGVYMAVGGGIFALFGLFARFVARKAAFEQSGGSSFVGFPMDSDSFSQGLSVVSLMTLPPIVIGLLMAAGGIALAIALRKWGRKEKQNLL